MGAISFNNKLYPTGGTNQASDSVYDNSSTGLPTTTQGAIDKTTDNIASANSVELAATAVHTHAVGTYFIWIGQFVKVTSAIAVGDTIADGTNVEATSIADVLAAANGAIEGKLSPSDVINNLTSTATNLPLSAAMGKRLSEAKQDKLTNPLTQSDIINNLTSTATNVPLSAAMGKALKDFTTNISRTSIQLESGVRQYGGTNFIKKIANFCELYLELWENSFTINTGIRIGTIPEGFRPYEYRIMFPIAIENGYGVIKQFGEGIIDANGSVHVVVPDNGFTIIHIFYICA